MATTKYLQLAISNDSGVSHMLSTGYCPLIKLFGPKDSTKFTLKIQIYFQYPQVILTRKISIKYLSLE